MTAGPLDQFISSSKRLTDNKIKSKKFEYKNKTSSSKRTYKTNSKYNPKQSKFNDFLQRNHGFDNHIFDETTVSLNKQGSRKPPWRLMLRIKDNWQSEYISIQHLLDHLSRKTRSLQSVRTYCGVLAGFCVEYDTNPDKLVSLSREDVESKVQNYCDKLNRRSMKRGPSTRYAYTVMVSLKTFFTCNGFNRQNGTELRLQSYHQPPRTTNRPEYIPSLKEALMMAERCGCKRDRAIILTLISTGIRNSTLRALKISDILDELKADRKNLLIKIDASWNDRISGACKNCIPYFTFTSEIATDATKSMLKEREANFDSYSPEEPLFISDYNQIHRSERRVKKLTSERLQGIIHEAAQAADIAQWKNVYPHTMRKVYESILRSQLADGPSMDLKDQEFLMGHILPGSQDNYYDRSKIERMRHLCSKLVFEDRTPVSEMNRKTREQIARLLGIDLQKVKMTKENELGRTLSDNEEEKLLQQQIKLKQEVQNQEEHKVIQTSQIDEYVKSGWSIQMQLNDDRLVIKKSFTHGSTDNE
ncbi:tyrosine-type recombinase/integrase [Thermoproteota archaeon]